MRKEKKDSKPPSKAVFTPIIIQFDHKRAEQFETKSKEYKSTDPFISSILHITKDLPKSPKP